MKNIPRPFLRTPAAYARLALWIALASGCAVSTTEPPAPVVCDAVAYSGLCNNTSCVQLFDCHGGKPAAGWPTVDAVCTTEHVEAELTECCYPTVPGGCDR